MLKEINKLLLEAVGTTKVDEMSMEQLVVVSELLNKLGKSEMQMVKVYADISAGICNKQENKITIKAITPAFYYHLGKYTQVYNYFTEVQNLLNK